MLTMFLCILSVSLEYSFGQQPLRVLSLILKMYSDVRRNSKVKSFGEDSKRSRGTGTLRGKEQWGHLRPQKIVLRMKVNKNLVTILIF